MVISMRSPQLSIGLDEDGYGALSGLVNIAIPVGLSITPQLPMM